MKLNLKLNNRYKHNIKSNIIFYIAASILTMLCVMAFALLYTCGTGIQNYVNNLFKEKIVEDANFSAFSTIKDEEIPIIEEKFNVLLEKQQYFDALETKTLDDDGNDVTTDNTRARIFSENTKTNLYTITEQKSGYNLSSVSELKNDEIVINEKYAIKHNISLESDNSRIIIGEKKYKIVGFFVRPDYLYMVENATDTYANYNSFFIAYLNDDEFNEYNSVSGGNISFATTYSLKYDVGGLTDVDKLRTYLFDNYIVYQYNVALTSGRIKMLYTRPKMYISFSFLFLAITPIAVVALIAIVLNIKIKNDQKIIGTIEALGYSGKEVCYHYAILSVIPGIIGGILMTIIVYISSGFFGKLATGDFEVMKIDFIYPWYMAILGITIPSIIYVLASIVTVKVLINKPITTLLRGAGTKSKASSFLTKKRTKITYKFALRSLVINKGRTFVVFLGVMISTLIITLSLMMFDTIDGIVSQAMKKAGDFEYEYTLSIPQLASEEDISSQDENYMIATIYEYNDRKIPLMGASTSNMNLWYTTLVDGTKITSLTDDDFYMSKLCARLMKVNVGDEITIYSNFNKEPLKFTLTGIIDNGLLSYIITTKANVIDSYFSTIYSLFSSGEFDSELVDVIMDFFTEEKKEGKFENLYNIVLSKESLGDKIESSDILNIFQKSSIEKQKDAKLKERTPIIYTVLIIGILICVIAVFTVVNVIIEDNQGNISMLMVLGYKQSEINRMIIDGNHVLVPIGIGVGIPLAYLILSIYFRSTVENNNIIMPVTISIKTIFIVIGTIIATYALTLLALKRKAARVNMIDSLKDNR